MILTARQVAPPVAPAVETDSARPCVGFSALPNDSAADLSRVHKSHIDWSRVAWSTMRVHLIGIGGCGMRGAAGLLQVLGAKVSGSDAVGVADASELVACGAVLHIGHDAGFLPPMVDLVVISAAIPDNNPELTAARAQGLPVLTYAELLGALMSAREGVSIAGTHGKSTTTAMTALILRHAKLDPTFIVGAHSEQLGGSSGVGRGDSFVVESCEFGRSFLHQRPLHAAILNIERDHLDCYADFDEIVDAFGAFAGRVRTDGVLVVPITSAAAMQAAAKSAAIVETFGIDAAGTGADWLALTRPHDRGCYGFDVLHNGERLLQTSLAVAGVHNVANALAAIALSHHAGASPSAIAEAVAAFAGIDRRMSYRGVRDGVTVIDDYAHHPTEIAVTLRAVRGRYEPRRTWVVFQPHQHSRTRALMEEFLGCFGDADVILVPDIYAARDSEEARRGVDSAELVNRLRSAGREVHYVPTLGEVTARLLDGAAAGDVVVTMGAGDVWKVANDFVEGIRRAG